MSPLSLVTAHGAARPAHAHAHAHLNGNSHHQHQQAQQHLHATALPEWSMSHLGPEYEARVSEYVRLLSREFRSNPGATPTLPSSIAIPLGVAGGRAPGTVPSAATHHHHHHTSPRHHQQQQQQQLLQHQQLPPPQPQTQLQSGSPLSSSPPRQHTPEELPRLPLWPALYPPATPLAAAAAAAAAVVAAAAGSAPEPQQEALNLEVRDQVRQREREPKLTPHQQPILQQLVVKRECEEHVSPPPAKRQVTSSTTPPVASTSGNPLSTAVSTSAGPSTSATVSNPTTTGASAPAVGNAVSDDEGSTRTINQSACTHISITSRGEGPLGNDNSLIVSMDLNGMKYQGILFAIRTPRTS